MSLDALAKSFKNAGAPHLAEALLKRLIANGMLKRYKYKAYKDKQKRAFNDVFDEAIDSTETWVGIDLNRLKLLTVSEETMEKFKTLLGDSS